MKQLFDNAMMVFGMLFFGSVAGIAVSVTMKLIYRMWSS